MHDGPNGGGLSRKAILSEIDKSLTRLGTDYVDLYQIHRWDYQTPIEETMEALHDVVKAGKARYIGASAMYAWQFQKALHVAETHGWTRFVSMQNHLNLIYREEEREMLPLCRAEKIGVIPYSPLASGRLTRDWSPESTLRSETDQIARSKYDATADTDRQIVERVAEIAEKHGVPRVHIALAWLLQKTAGDGAHRRGNEDLASGRRRRRAVRDAEPGRGGLPGRALCAASRRRRSVGTEAVAMPSVIVVIGADQFGQAIARRVGVRKQVLLADLRLYYTNAAGEVFGNVGYEVSKHSRCVLA